MKQFRKTYIQRFYNAIKAYSNREAKYEHLTPIQKIKIFRQLKREAKQADEKFEMEIKWFMECLDAKEDTVLMDLMLILCYFNAPLEKVFEIIEAIGFELAD